MEQEAMNKVSGKTVNKKWRKAIFYKKKKVNFYY